MSNLAWLGIPVLAMVLATIWVNWRARPRTPQDPQDTVAAYERFRAAMAAASGRGPRRPE